MILASLKLQNFRSYSKNNFTFSAGTTLVVGGNTSGKTNLLEAIYLLATGKSFRADREGEMIQWGAEMSNVKCQMSNEVDTSQLEIILTQGQIQGRKIPTKKYLVNGVARKQIDFVGNLRAVLFWPEDLELVTDSPSLRRKYLDGVLVQVDREYRRNLYSYERGLRQRNKLLDFVNAGTASRHQLLFWNQLLIKAGGYLTDKRAEFIDFINTYRLSRIMYHVEYDKSVISESRLAQYAEEEIAAKATLVGPHRDDFVIKKEIRDMKIRDMQEDQDKNVSPLTSHLSLSAYGSRGEQRLAILWLKLAELSYIEKQVGERPILLLDDIFSELDQAHRDLVGGIIGKQQTIIASADPQGIPRRWGELSETITLKTGKL